MKKLVLVDGNNLLFRSYYATAYNGNVMKNSKGFPTNGIYGLINMLNKIIDEEKPEYMMVAFDKGKTFRHEKYTDYKGGRSETPNELKQQFPVAKKIVEAMGITYLECDNYEADDIIGTFAKKANLDDCFEATIVSSDKDLLQLITDDVEVKLLKPVGYIRMTKNEFIKTYGIEPIRMVDLKSLMGDSSDNIPGVKGIGEKTAINLLKEYETLDNIYNNIDNIKGKLKEKLLIDKENAYMSYDLATINKEAPVNTDFESIKYHGINALEYIELLEDLEFYSLIKKLNLNKENIKKEEVNDTINYKEITNLEDLKIDKDYSLYLEILGYNYHKCPIIGLGIYSDTFSYYIDFDFLVKNPNILKTGFNILTYDIKKVINSLRYKNISIDKCNYDLMIASYLLNYNIKDDISFLMKNNNSDVLFYEEEFGTDRTLKMPEDVNIVKENIMKKAKYIYDTKNKIIEELNKEDAMYLFEKIEMPLSYVLADMEYTGIKVNRHTLMEMGKDFDERLDKLSKEIYDLAGKEFNISSPKQLGEVLFVDLGIPYPKKIKDTNYSTSKDILDKVYDCNPIIEKILNYRTISKLSSTYVTGIIQELDSDDIIHTTFNQTLTRTGRLSSSNPNLQNIPVRLEEGRLIRKAFIPYDNSILLSSDYSQIELRLFASLSNATNMIEAFVEGKDIHSKTASDIFNVKIEDVTKDMRRSAKAINFGILYGMSSFGLSEGLNMSVKQAKEFIDNYLDTYPRIKEYMDGIVKQAHIDGYVKTIMNRKRIIEELNNKNYMIRLTGERMAMNTPVQGSSADILKKAMIEIYDKFNELNLKSKMLIQVHDELVFNVYKDEEEIVTNIVKDIMENTYKLSVPLVVDINKGNDWYEAK